MSGGFADPLSASTLVHTYLVVCLDPAPRSTGSDREWELDFDLSRFVRDLSRLDNTLCSSSMQEPDSCEFPTLMNTLGCLLCSRVDVRTLARRIA